MRALIDWIEDRTGLISTVEHFMNEEIPASSGWHQVFGSVAMFLFLVQAFTGIMLGLNYGPTPGEAHSSLRYIMSVLSGGALIRGLHHWGASAMVIVVVSSRTMLPAPPIIPAKASARFSSAITMSDGFS